MVAGAVSLCVTGDVLFAQGGPAVVRVGEVTQQQVGAEQSFVANVRPRRRTMVGSAVDGRVLEYLVEAGQEVKDGDTLAQLRIKTIGIELAAAQAEQRLREAELSELRNGSRKAELELAEATAQAAAAAKDYARAKFRRFERLYEQNSGVSRDEFEAAQAEALEAAAKLAEADSNLKLVQEGPRAEQISQAEARLAVQEQVVAGLEDRMAKYTLRSPFDGYVASEATQAGAWVRQGDPVAEVIEIDPVEVEVYVPETSVRFVPLGAEVNVHVPAAGNETFKGTVNRIVPIAETRSRTFPVQVVVPNPKVDGRHRLLPGMLAQVSLPSGGQQERLLVPKDALQLGGQSPVVWKVVAGKAMVVPVRLGPALDSLIAVEALQSDQLTVGDTVITRGNERVRPGQEVVVSGE